MTINRICFHSIWQITNFENKFWKLPFFNPVETNGKRKKIKNGRSDVRSSLTYPPTYIRYHQMQLDIPTYLPKNLTSYVNAPLYELVSLISWPVSRHTVCTINSVIFGFSNFSCMFLNPNIFFQFEFSLFYFIRCEKPPGTS